MATGMYMDERSVDCLVLGHHDQDRKVSAKSVTTRGVQYVMKTAQYIPKVYIYTLYNYFYLKICFLAK